MNWLTENWETILQILGGIYAVATLIAALTPSDRDDTFLAKVGKVFDRIGLDLKSGRKGGKGTKLPVLPFVALLALTPLALTQPGCQHLKDAAQNPEIQDAAKLAAKTALILGLQAFAEKNPDYAPYLSGLPSVIDAVVQSSPPPEIAAAELRGAVVASAGPDAAPGVLAGWRAEVDRAAQVPAGPPDAEVSAGNQYAQKIVAAFP